MSIAPRYYLPFGLAVSAGIHVAGAILLPTLLANHAPLADTASPPSDVVTIRIAQATKKNKKAAAGPRAVPLTVPKPARPLAAATPPPPPQNVATPPPITVATPAPSPGKPTTPLPSPSAVPPAIPAIFARPAGARILTTLRPRPSTFTAPSLPTRTPESGAPTLNAAPASAPTAATPGTKSVSAAAAAAPNSAASNSTTTSAAPPAPKESAGGEKQVDSSLAEPGKGEAATPAPKAEAPTPAPRPPQQPLTRAKARYRTNPKPAYPDEARRRHEEGVVRLLVSISEDGRVTDATVERSSGFDDLDAAALSSVKQWEFEPARRGDAREASRVIIPIRFGQE